ncbi:MAG: hypothetical protein Q8K15_05260, partial [Candidatus Omnitrophota bacterium]|nr:hypothetical protein [Candidatus Omnitrophota bacterium]
MHDTHLLKSILKYLEGQEGLSSRKIKKINVSISEFGALSKEHFLEHFKEAVRGTKWQALEITVNIIPFGAELEITGLEFAASEAGTRFCAAPDL